jgi:hypothetical protein
MESFLNFLWLLIALAALGAWRVCWIRQASSTRRTPFQGWTAFAIALIFLFFAVSLTDDLHSDLVFSDEAAGGRRHSVVYECAHPSIQHSKLLPPSGAAAIGSLYSFSPLSEIWRTAPADSFPSPFREQTFVSPRAPPLSYL